MAQSTVNSLNLNIYCDDNHLVSLTAVGQHSINIFMDYYDVLTK